MARLDKKELRKRLEQSERRRTRLQRMVKQRTAEEDTFLWSMADLMTLLLIFFILFYSHAVGKTVDTKDCSHQDQPSLQTVKPSLAPVEEKKEAAVKDLDVEKRDQTVEELKREVFSTLEAGEQRDFSVRWDQTRLVLVLGERITFRVGKAELLVDFRPALSRIAAFIAHKKGYDVVVLGHTDDTPIHNAQFPSNWELSAARAVAVAKFLIEKGVRPGRVSIRGYSEYRPLYKNTTPENRQANRRVEIMLTKEQGSQPSFQATPKG
jgi:chemotaxis protein MotB